MKRRTAREHAFIAFFAYSFGTDMEDVIMTAADEDSGFVLDDFGTHILRVFTEHKEEIDTQIQSKLKGWNVNRIPKVNLAILRLAVTELLFGEPGLDSVIINEAVELSKQYGDETDYQFVNGVLGNVAREKTNLSPAAEV